jgi:hypothetical protein
MTQHSFSGLPYSIESEESTTVWPPENMLGDIFPEANSFEDV